MNDVDTQQTKVTVASRIPADLAAEVTRMAEVGNRTVSREIWAAVAEHVGRQDPGVVPDPPTGRPETDERRGLVGPAAARGEREKDSPLLEDDGHREPHTGAAVPSAPGSDAA